MNDKETIAFIIQSTEQQLRELKEDLLVVQHESTATAINLSIDKLDKWLKDAKNTLSTY